MADIKIEVTGLKTVNTFLTNLPSKLNSNFDKVLKQFASTVSKSAKLKAPRFSGQLADSIKVTPNKKGDTNMISIVVDSPYAYFQEMGFPPNFLGRNLVVEGGYTIGDWMDAKGLKGKGITPSGVPRPFIAPAIELGLAKLPNMINMALNEALK